MSWQRIAEKHGRNVLGHTLLLVAIAAWGCGEAPAKPTLTAQGFDLSQTRETRIGEPSSLRLRIEAPAGLESVRVRERSFDVDLARSRDPAHIPLFGLSRRVWSKTDVTLDFGPYVIEKLTVPGDYAFEIAVTDRKGNAAKATLPVRVQPAQDTEPSDEDRARNALVTPLIPSAKAPAGLDETSRIALHVRDFRLERVGRGSVAEGDVFGVSWKTVESTRVVIRIAGARGETSRFARLQPGAFAATDSEQQLAELLARTPTQTTLELAAANNAAAGTEVAIIQPGANYLLLTDRSQTHLSERGTTVTLTGRYKR